MNNIETGTVDVVGSVTAMAPATDDIEFEKLCEKIDKFANEQNESKKLRKLCLAWTNWLRKCCEESQKMLRFEYATKLWEQIEQNALNDPFCKLPQTNQQLEPLRVHIKLRQCSQTIGNELLPSSWSLSSSSSSSSAASSQSLRSVSSCSSTEDDKELKLTTSLDRKRSQQHKTLNENIELRQQVVELKKQLFALRNEIEQLTKIRDNIQTDLRSLQSKIATDYVPLAELNKFKDESAQKYKSLLKSSVDGYKSELNYQNEIINQLKLENDKLIRLNDEIAVKNKEQMIQNEQKLIREKIQSESFKIDLKESFEKTLNKELNFFRTKSEKLEQVVSDLEKENRKLNRKLKTYVTVDRDYSNMLQQPQPNTLAIVGELSKQADLMANFNEKRNNELARITGELEARYRSIIEDQQQKFRSDSKRNLERIANLNRALAKQQPPIDGSGDDVQYSLSF